MTKMTIMTDIRRAIGGYNNGAKSWTKALESIDRTQATGYAFQGEFVKDQAPVELELGTILLHHRVVGSRKRPDAFVALARVTGADEVEVLKTWKVPLEGWALRVRDAVAEEFANAKPSDKAAIEAEIAALESRLAELRAKLEG